MTSFNEWIDTKIKDGNIDYTEYSEFSDVEKIGEGGFGIVKSAKWKNYGIKIALKTLINNSSVDENSMNEFVKELKNLKQVSFHPNINGFFGITKEPLSNKYAMVLEFANQGDLRIYLRIHFNDLQWSDKIRMALDIVCGLKCLHFKHIIHRDLHAKNILVNNHKLMIADFGTSKQLSESTSGSNSAANGIGMIEYMEPQCFKNIKYKKTKKSDIYSLGVLLWEISSGRPPFLGYSRCALGTYISYNNREEPIDGTPPEYKQLYQKCWDDNPDLRPDIEKVYETLDQLKVKDSPHLQSSQSERNNISDCLNSTRSNCFTEEVSKNFDVDIEKLNLEDYIGNVTYDNLGINDTIVTILEDESEIFINAQNVMSDVVEVKFKNENNRKEICETALNGVLISGKTSHNSFNTKRSELKDVINNWQNRFPELRGELEGWKRDELATKFMRKEILIPLYRGKRIKCIFLKVYNKGEEEGKLRFVSISGDIQIKAKDRLFGKLPEIVKSHPEIIAALIISRSTGLKILWE
ncbi:hypothetical protein RclHR1_10830005 [Rhizophagus clarus]|uniref:Kinase-like domain-containing protein n=1 Tax=Rhizophagus clarus TaxID=94130 RepID=A0A2Z6QHE3_9GLOM|nr:hypothetical protein RclHR1_10830005 [Rhizophagus clarus]GES80283.1 kinase-like domain-containing protein [Rhizophagus clarus]